MIMTSLPWFSFFCHDIRCQELKAGPFMSCCASGANVFMFPQQPRPSSAAVPCLVSTQKLPFSDKLPYLWFFALLALF